MFVVVAWKSFNPRDLAFPPEHDLCPHDPADPDAWVASIASLGATGQPRELFLLPCALRPCCARDAEAPQARLLFWDVARDAIGRSPEARPHRGTIESRLTARITAPSAEEAAIWQVYGFNPVARRSPRGSLPLQIARWQQARQVYQRYLRTRSVAETFVSWNARQPDASLWSTPEPAAPPRPERPREHDRPRPPPAARQLPPCLSVLGLRLPCSEADVRAAWKRLAARAHPDQGGDHETFVAITRARDEAILWLAMLDD